MIKYLFAFLWFVLSGWMWLFGVFMVYAYTQHGDYRNLIVVAFAGIFAIGFTSLFLDRFVKAIAHSVYTVKKGIDQC